MKWKPALMCILFCAGLLSSCKDLNFTHPGDTYYYYPQKNVYYDVSRSNFIYSLDSGKTWDSMYSETSAPAIMGPRETVYSTESPVWRDNAVHLETYGGTMLNIINEESLKVPEPVVAKRKNTGSKSATAETEPEKKERKRPIRNFFKKLFGKKN